MPVLTLPSTFNNSFWSQDYRKGLEVLYAKLEQGVAENGEILAFIKARIHAERNFAATLTAPLPKGYDGVGFGADDGASLYMAFRGLQHETAAQASIHSSIANDLQSQVTEPFEVWAHQHSTRIGKSKEDILEGWLYDFELSISDVAKVRETYISKSHKADEAEDDARFAPNNQLQETPAPNSGLSPSSGTVKRTASVAERITQRLKGFSAAQPRDHPMPSFPEPKNTLQMLNQPERQLSDDNAEARSDGTATPTKVDKGKGKEVSSPLNMSPQNISAPLPGLSLTIPEDGEKSVPPLVLAGIAIPAPAVSALLFKAQTDLPLRSVRFTILGEYENCFSGEEFVTWMKEHVKELEGNLDKAAEASKDLTETYDALRRIGELGNKFENSATAYYQFRPKAFNLQSTLARKATAESDTPLTPITQGLLQKSGSVVSIIAKTLSSNTDQSEPPYVRARKEAQAAEQIYRTAVRQLDKQRLVLEERIEDVLKALQRWETDRLRAVKTVLLQYQGVIAAIGGSLAASNEKSSVLLSSFIPENDINALIERYRTGPFRPTARIYESITRDGTDVVFGIDLRKWAAEGAFSPVKSSISSVDELHLQSAKDIPPVLKGLLDGLNDAYPHLPDDDQRRKIWIYEVPLASVHHLREAINALPFDSPVPKDLLTKYDAPVLASTVKLWALELNPPLGMWEGWTDVRKIYPHVGALEEKERVNIVDDLKNALIRLPKIHLMVLDAIISHLKKLIETTITAESNDLYINKLALSMGRALLRPQVENSLSIQDQHPHLLMIDLLEHYDAVLPPTIEQKKKEMDRPMPTRKRTKLVDARINRKSIDATQDPRKLLEAQFALQNPRSRPSSPNPMERPRFVSPPTSPRNSLSVGGRPTFISPPSSPPAGATSHPALPTIQTMGVQDEGAPHGASVKVHPPTPVNLNDETSPVHKPESETPPQATFVPPPPPPAINPSQQTSSNQPRPGSPRTGSPKTSASSIDSSSSLSRSGSAGGGDARPRGPRVAGGARGPRPLATQASATVNQPQAPQSGVTRPTASSRQRGDSFGRGGGEDRR
ncbi:hypothetical protein FRC02_005910 [Tulasnella sp. 418]|nr:hypothetical protein FRC02_005910 [Tulasnella sp. 418]